MNIKPVSMVAVLAVAASLSACSSSNPPGNGKSKAPPGNRTTATVASSSSSAPVPAQTGGPSDPLVVNSADKQATVYVVAGKGGGLNFDGDQNGKLTVTVPAGWQITVECHDGASIPHSCAIVSGGDSTTPAFPGAETLQPFSGIAPGQTEAFAFTATTVGTYRLVCLVPGHESAGMWGTFIVSASASAPTITS